MSKNKTIGSRKRAVGQAQDHRRINQIIAQGDYKLLDTIQASNDWSRLKPLFIHQLNQSFTMGAGNYSVSYLTNKLVENIDQGLLLEICHANKTIPTRLLAVAAPIIWQELEPILMQEFISLFEQANSIKPELNTMFIIHAPLSFIKDLGNQWDNLQRNLLLHV